DDYRNDDVPTSFRRIITTLCLLLVHFRLGHDGDQYGLVHVPDERLQEHEQKYEPSDQNGKAEAHAKYDSLGTVSGQRAQGAGQRAATIEGHLGQNTYNEK